MQGEAGEKAAEEDHGRLDETSEGTCEVVHAVEIPALHLPLAAILCHRSATCLHEADCHRPV